MKLHFRKIKDSELEPAYRLHCSLVMNMLGKGIDQWRTPIDRGKLVHRQSRGENFGLFDENQKLLVFLSLVSRREYHEWAGWFSDEETVWLNTVSVGVENAGKGLGRIAIEEAIAYLKRERVNELYLDCVNDNSFLVNYYQSLGFESIANTVATYKSGTFNMVLMKKSIL